MSNKDRWLYCGGRRMQDPASCTSMTATIATAPTSLLIACGNHEPCPSALSNANPTETDASNTLTSDQWRTTNRIATPYQQSFTITSSSSWSTSALITRSSHAGLSSSLSSSTTSSPTPSSTPTIDTNQANQANIGSSNTGTSTTGISTTSISNTSSTASASGVDSRPSSIWIGSVTASVCAFLIVIGLILWRRYRPWSDNPSHRRGFSFHIGGRDGIAPRIQRIFNFNFNLRPNNPEDGLPQAKPSLGASTNTNTLTREQPRKTADESGIRAEFERLTGRS